MRPLTPHLLAENPYRTLGVSASATAAEVESAARRMRIWPDPSRIPPTPWDVPFLGPPARSRQQIEQAVVALRDPASRLEARLLWYTDTPQADHPGDDARSRHNRSLAALHRLAAEDPAIADTGRWRQVVADFDDLAANEAYHRWLGEQEQAGGFEKRTSPQEIAPAAAARRKALADYLVLQAQTAMDRGDSARCGTIHEILAAAPAESADASTSAIADRLEDAIASKCNEVDDVLRPKLETDHSNPQPYYMANAMAASNAEDEVDSKIRPLLLQLTAVCVHQPDRLTRARTTLAELLNLIALGWEWGGQYVRAEETGQEALALAEASPGLAASIRRLLERVAPHAEREREWSRSRVVKTAGLLGGNWRPNVHSGTVEGTPGGTLNTGDDGQAGQSQDAQDWANAWAAHQQTPRRQPPKQTIGGGKGWALFLIILLFFLIRIAGTNSPSSRSNVPVGPSLSELRSTLEAERRRQTVDQLTERQRFLEELAITLPNGPASLLNGSTEKPPAPGFNLGGPDAAPDIAKARQAIGRPNYSIGETSRER